LTLFRVLRKALGHREDIARLLEVELEEAPFYLESEFIEGGNLGEWGGTDGHLAALPLEARLRLVAEIAEAVAAAHSVGIIHRDLKPSNVFMRQAADGRWHPILADFGIGAVADRSQLEQHGVPLIGFTRTILDPGSRGTGTRMYQPPEANLARPATMQGDVYALGVLLYQMVIGDFDQPLGIGWERRVDAIHLSSGQWSGVSVPDDVRLERDGRRETAKPVPPSSSSSGRPAPATRAPGARPLRSLDPSGELVLRLLRDDIAACVDGDPSARLATAAQLVKRLQTMDTRVADGLARRRAERAALWMRRLCAALVVAATLLVVVGSLGAFAFSERQRAIWNEKRAIENEQRAEQNERKALSGAEAARKQSQETLGTLKAVIFEIQPALKKLPRSSPVRLLLLNAALKQLERLSGEYVQQSTVDRETAATLNELGDLMLHFSAGPGGGGTQESSVLNAQDLRSAVESARLYTRSMQIFRVLKTNPNDAQARRGLADSSERLGNAQLLIGEPGKAMQAYQECLELREDLAQAAPNDAQARRDLSVSHEKLGDASLRLGETAKAMQAYQECLRLREDLAQTAPNDAHAQYGLSVSYEKLGDALLRLGETAKAMQAFEKSLGLRKDKAYDPDDAQAQRDLANSYERLGDAHLRLGKTASAALALQNSLDLRKALAEADPSNAQAQRDLANSYERLGDTHLGSGETTKATRAFQKSLELRETFRADSKDAQAQRDRANSHERLGDVHLQLGEPAKAVQAFLRSLGLREALTEVDLTDAHARRDVSVSYVRLGDAYLQLGETGRAMQCLNKGLKLSEALIKINPSDVRAKLCLSISYEKLGDAHSHLGETAEAVEAYQQGLDLREALAKVDPNDTQAKRDLSISCKKLAWLLATSWDDLVRDGNKAIELSTRACELTQWKDADSFHTLAAACAKAGKFKDAVKWQKKALEHPEGISPAELERFEERLKLYEAGKPYHEPKPERRPSHNTGQPSR
jgi:tetratricopeptide (TPR) repeat protein